MGPLDRVVSSLRHVVFRDQGSHRLYDSWWFQGLTFTGLWVIGHEVRGCVCVTSILSLSVLATSVDIIPSRRQGLCAMLLDTSSTLRFGPLISVGSTLTIGTTVIMRRWRKMNCEFH